MFLLFASLVLVASSLFFYSIGLWYLGFLPVLFFLFLFSTSPSFQFSSLFSRKIFSYPLIFAWAAILIALGGLSWYLGISLVIIFLVAIVLNIILWIGSLILSYDDGKQIFSFGYWFSLSLFLLLGLFFCSFSQYFGFLFLLSSLHLGFFAFALFVLRLWFPQLIDLMYYFLIGACVWLVLCVLTFVPNFVLALVLAGGLLFGMYSALWRFYQQKPVEQKQISIRRILAGEKIYHKTVFSNLFLAKTSAFLHAMPKSFLSSLEFLNIGLIISLLGFFAGHRSTISEFTQILYWGVIALFVSNTMILKKITTTNVLQNLFLFLIVHFAVYVSFFSYFGSSIGPVVFWTILWNLFTSVFIFYMERVSPLVLTRLDYRYWLIAGGLSFVCNILLLVQAPLPGELIFFLMLLYLGTEGILLFYGIKYVHSMEEIE